MHRQSFTAFILPESLSHILNTNEHILFFENHVEDCKTYLLVEQKSSLVEKTYLMKVHHSLLLL